MRRLLAASFILIATATTGAQQRPNFSGTWTQDLLASRWEGRGNSNTRDSPGGSLNLWGPPAQLTITQDDKTLRVEEYYPRIPDVLSFVNTVIYSLDGRTVTNPVLDSDHSWNTRPAAFTSQWKDNQLVSTFTFSVLGEAAPRRYERTISLNIDGALVVRTQAIGTPHAIIILYRKKVAG